MKNFDRKKKALLEQMEECTKEDVIVAFSGGVDSSLLLKLATAAAARNGSQVYACTIHTILHPMEELELTERLAKEMGAVHRVIQVDEITEAGIENNPVNRCYLCKKCMFGKVKEEGKQLGVSRIIEGTNMEDTKAYRPGIQAVKELAIRSPLMETGFTKDEVRKMAAEYGISVSEKPATPCLATRFPYNTKLEKDQLEKAGEMERLLRQAGFYNVRARIHGPLLKIEVDEKDIGKLVEKKSEVIKAGKELGYAYVTVDLEGFRSGSQDTMICHHKD